MQTDNRRTRLSLILAVIAVVYVVVVRFALVLESPHTAMDWAMHVSATLLAVIAVMLLLRENLERGRIERKLRTSEERYASLVRGQAAGIAAVDPREVFTFANPAAEEIFGVPPGTLAGRSLLDFIDEQTCLLFREQTAERRRGASGTYECEITRPDGRRAIIVVTAAPQFHERGSFAGSLAIFRDITSQKNAEKALQLSRDRLAAAQQLAQIGYFEYDLRTGEHIWTPEMFRIMDLDPSESAKAAFATYLERQDAASREKTLGTIVSAIERKEPFENDLRMAFPDGSVRYVLTVGGPIADENGKTILLRGACVDVTRHRMTEAALHETLSLQKAILDNSGYSIVATDSEGVIRLFNRAAEKLLGYAAAEVVGRATPALFYRPEDIQARAALLSSELGHPVAPDFESLSIMARAGCIDERESTYVRSDGACVRVQVSVTAIHDAAGAVTGYVGIFHDITEREALERERAQLAAILDTTRDFVAISDGQAHAWYINREGLRMTGISRSGPANMYEMARVHPAWAMQKIRNEALPTAKEKGSWLGETALLDAGGQEIPVSQLVMAHRDQGGSIEFISTVARDISELKRAQEERERARREAEQANAAKSQFLSRMSHELRTPMNAILGFAQLLEMQVDEPKQRKMLGHILKGGSHLLALLDDLLDVGRMETGRLSISIQPVQVSDAVAEVVALVQSAADGGKVSIHVEPHSGRTLILADRQRLRQALLNLLTNAVKYNEAGGKVFISVEPKGEFVRISVRDTGVGIPPEKAGLLFHYFERLGAEQTGIEGTGIGLALSKRLLEGMGGRIGMSSEAGRGSTFWLELPVCRDNPDRVRSDPQAAACAV